MNDEDIGANSQQFASATGKFVDSGTTMLYLTSDLKG